MFRRGETYYARIMVGGIYRKMTLGTKDKAEARRRLNALAKGYDMSDDERLAALTQHLRPKSERRSLDEAWSEYVSAPVNATQSARARNEDKYTWQGFMWWLHGHDGGPECRTNCKAAHPEVDAIGDFSPKMACEFFQHIRGKDSPHTVNRYVRILKRIWRVNGVEPNPWEDFRKLKEDTSAKRALTREEVDRLIDMAHGELRTLLVVGAYTGLRMSDCAKLRWASVDGDRLFVKTSKTKRLAGIPLHPVLKKELQDAGKTARRSEYVMPGLANAPKWQLSSEVMAHFRSCGLDEHVQEEGRRAIPLVGFHSLRSTFITRLGEAGVPLAVVRDMVGHVSEEMSFRYFRSDEDMARRAIAALG